MKKFDTGLCADPRLRSILWPFLRHLDQSGAQLALWSFRNQEEVNDSISLFGYKTQIVDALSTVYAHELRRSRHRSTSDNVRPCTETGQRTKIASIRYCYQFGCLGFRYVQSIYALQLSRMRTTLMLLIYYCYGLLLLITLFYVEITFVAGNEDVFDGKLIVVSMNKVSKSWCSALFYQISFVQVYSVALTENASMHYYPHVERLALDIENGSDIRAIDSVNDRLYLALSSGAIHFDDSSAQGSIHLYANRELHCIVDHIAGIESIAVDWITNNIYYTMRNNSERTCMLVSTE